MMEAPRPANLGWPDAAAWETAKARLEAWLEHIYRVGRVHLPAGWKVESFMHQDWYPHSYEGIRIEAPGLTVEYVRFQDGARRADLVNRGVRLGWIWFSWGERRSQGKADTVDPRLRPVLARWMAALDAAARRAGVVPPDEARRGEYEEALAETLRLWSE